MSPEKLILPAFALAGLVAVTLSLTGTSEPMVGRNDAEQHAPPFVERFATLDRDRWFVSDGWKNGKYAINDWRASQTAAQRGLTLTLAPNTTKIAEYSSGEIQSHAVYVHGYFEVRMRAARGSGIVTGFFTYTGPYYKKPWHEIDIEVLGKATDRIQVTYFTDAKKVKKTLPLGFDASEAFHLYAFDWQRDAIRWYVDGKLIHEAKGDAMPLPTQPQKIMVGLWGSDTLRSWLGPFDKGAVPATAEVKCVAYALDATAAGQCR